LSFSRFINPYYNLKNVKQRFQKILWIFFYSILLVFMLFIKCFVAIWQHDCKWFEIWFSWTFF
jgi:hypothetical protein